MKQVLLHSGKGNSAGKVSGDGWTTEQSGYSDCSGTCLLSPDWLSGGHQCSCGTESHPVSRDHQICCHQGLLYCSIFYLHQNSVSLQIQMIGLFYKVFSCTNSTFQCCILFLTFCLKKILMLIHVTKLYHIFICM